MTRDTELDRLHKIQEEAFQKKQQLYQTMKNAKAEKKRLQSLSESAWDDLQAAREEMNREHDEIVQSKSADDAVWEEYRRIKEYNKSRIESLKPEAERLYQSMSSCFDIASREYEYGDKAAAKSYSSEGHEYKEHLSRVNDEIRKLGAEVKQARTYAESQTRGRNNSALSAARKRFHELKRKHESLTAEYKTAKAEVTRAEGEFNAAQERFKEAQREFKDRLEYVKSQKEHRISEEDRLMDRAGVPFSYRRDCKVRRNADGSTDFFFGGLGSSDGYGHGHVSMDVSGNVTYNRDVFDEHGAQNFTDYQERQRESVRKHPGRFKNFVANAFTVAGVAGAMLNPMDYGPVNQAADYLDLRHSDQMSQVDNGRWNPEIGGKK